MEIAENITLGIALFWALWQFLSLRYLIANGKSVFPATIPSLLLYIICIVVVLAFHRSPFHLIWLAVVSFFLGVPLMMFPPVQGLSIGFMGLLAMTSNANNQEDEDSETIKSSSHKKMQIKPSKSSQKGKGFSSDN
jgi:hypothetical protein